MGIDLPGSESFLQGFAFLFVIGTAAVHVMFAIGVFHSASDIARREHLHFAPPFVWGIATLLGGVFAATAYWAMHLSNLARNSTHRSE